MSLEITMLLSFFIIGLSMIGLAFWSVINPNPQCQKIARSRENSYNVCIRRKSHPGAHMSIDGKRFYK